VFGDLWHDVFQLGNLCAVCALHTDWLDAEREAELSLMLNAGLSREKF
jgi:hypothetical protein